MNRGLKIALFATGIAAVGFAIYWFGFRDKKPKESGGNDKSPLVHDKASRNVVLN